MYLETTTERTKKMAKNNKDKLGTYRKYFITLPPHVQLAEVDKHKDLATIVAMYPHAKDDLIRYNMVTKTKNIRLAEKLASNTRYKKLAMRVYNEFIKGGK